MMTKHDIRNHQASIRKLATPAHLAASIFVAVLLATLPAVAEDRSSRQAAAERYREELAFHVGTLAYVYGYPIVDLTAQMHAQTHAIEQDQQVLAPVNHFSRSEQLVTPSTQAGLRAPNNDTLYFRGWFDLSEGPVVLHTPDTHGRYYMMAVTNFFAEVQHLSRRTMGTQEQEYALVGPGWNGELPKELTPVIVDTQHVWILGRLLVRGLDDLPEAQTLLKGFWSTPLKDWRSGKRGEPPVPPVGERISPHTSLAAFSILDRFLRDNPRRPSEEGLLTQFASVGIGAGKPFEPASLDAATRRGLERAIESGNALVQGSTLSALRSVNGWITLQDAGRFGHDYLLRASVALGGYANLPEESVYPAAVKDEQGRPLMGSRRYRLHFPKDGLPPVNGFWSLSVYDAQTRSLVENTIARYSIGDRTDGLVRGEDGSLTLYLQHEPPAEVMSNWLPTPAGPLMFVIRLYEPAEAVLDESYRLPWIETVGESLK
ncbi:MAG: DUF1254 domain-containing protein [Myxococcota bacterium]|nr:DUF1254 domain-containing protein [Myxococcota bacterium]